MVGRDDEKRKKKTIFGGVLFFELCGVARQHKQLETLVL